MKNTKHKLHKAQKILFLFVFWFLCFGIFSVSYALVVVEVDTGRETINAIEGTLILPSGVEASEIYTGNSSILIWIVKPALNSSDNSITFSGLTPGGFSGKRPIFALEGVELNEVSNALFKEVSAFRNDGEGTPVEVKLSVVEGKALEEDLAPPEPFKPLISSSDDIFDGRHFISFAAQDKSTGIARYQYQAKWLFGPRDDSWLPIESPKVLSNAELFKRIYIRAIDLEGNYRTVSTPGPYSFITLLIGAIILICILLLVRRSFSVHSS